MEKTEPNNQKLWNIAFNILGFFPLLFIISLLAFYIHYSIILGQNILSILPINLDIHNVYQGIIIYSYIFSFFSLIVWIITSLAYFTKKKNVIAWKPIIINLLLYSAFVILALSKIMELALE
jgi:hypothetical protein